MDFGVPLDRHPHEHRVGLNPFAVARLTSQGHRVFVESRAGEESHFSDEDYAQSGAEIVFSHEETYLRADLVCGLRALDMEEARLLRPGSIAAAFHHLAVSRSEVIAELVERQITAIGYEIIENRHGGHPVLTSLSEIAGRMTVHLAAQLLHFESGGRGVVLGGVPGDAPATVVILGAGTVGSTAAKVLSACGAHVIVLDESLHRLRRAAAEIPQNIVTAIASARNVARFSAIADVLIGCVLIPGGRAPYLVSEEMVREMKTGAAIIDLAIDQGGCVETSRPTTLDDPTYTVHGVTHCCIPNMTTNAPRSASRVLSISALPYLLGVAGRGLEDALREDPGLRRGVYLYRGRFVNSLAADTHGLPSERLMDLLADA